jgi:hypothetical protein
MANSKTVTMFFTPVGKHVKAVKVGAVNSPRELNT